MSAISHHALEQAEARGISFDEIFDTVKNHDAKCPSWAEDHATLFWKKIDRKVVVVVVGHNPAKGKPSVKSVYPAGKAKMKVYYDLLAKQ